MLTGMETAYMNHSRDPLCARLCMYTCECVCARVCVSENSFKGNLGEWKKGLEKKGITLGVATQEHIFQTINLFLCPAAFTRVFLALLSSPPVSLLFSLFFPREPSSAFISLIQLSHLFPSLRTTPSIPFTLHLTSYSAPLPRS